MYRQRMARLPKPLQMQAVMLALLAFAVFVWNGMSAQAPEVPNVDVAAAQRMIEAGAAVVDVRGPEAFARRHLPGAISIPLPELRIAVPTVFAEATAQDVPVLVYCGEGLSIGPEGTALLAKAGYAKAVNLSTGIEGWVAAGLPVKM